MKVITIEVKKIVEQTYTYQVALPDSNFSVLNQLIADNTINMLTYSSKWWKRFGIEKGDISPLIHLPHLDVIKEEVVNFSYPAKPSKKRKF